MQITNNKTNPTFGYGITRHIATEISECDVSKVTKKFREYNIPTNFNNNKVFAYCSLKCLEIIQFLNSKYKLNLSLPNGIYVDNFKKLDIEINNAFGLTNLAPSTVYRNNDVIYPEQSIFFNDSQCTAEEFDEQADKLWAAKLQPSAFFLTPILHEFSHVIHNENLVNTLGGMEYIKRVLSRKIPSAQIPLIQKNICEYAGTDTFEAVACDISKRIVDNLDKKKLVPTANPLKNSPYREYNILEKLLLHSEFDKIMHKFWRGNF